MQEKESSNGFNRRLTIIILLLTVPGTMARYCGELMNSFPYIELLSHLVLPYLILLGGTIVIAIACRSWRTLPFVVAPFILNFALIYPYISGEKPEGKIPFSLLTHNLFLANRSIKEATEMIVQEDADLVALTEVSTTLIGALGPLREKYPYQVEHPIWSPFGLALYSKYPIVSHKIIHYVHPNFPTLLAKIQLPAREGKRDTILAVTHPPPGVNNRSLEVRNEQLRKMVESVRSESSVILTGDFNISMWSYWYPRLFPYEKWRNSREGIGIFPTWDARLPTPLGIPIDHVITTPDIIAIDMTSPVDPGSDHRPIRTTLSFN